MSAVWSAAAAAIAGHVYRDRRMASIIGLVVFSHWMLDDIAHAPDRPLLFTGSPTVGLGPEYSATGDIHWRRALAAELGLLAAGAVVNRVATHDAGRHAP
jgi:hypothetical protein